MIQVTAPAKINFFLEITGKRPDGYHTLSIVFQTISLGDELTLEPANDISLTCSDKVLPTDERNLVMKAAVRLRHALKETRGAKIHLTKIVPTGAGLGGGSSDAAAALLALQRLWNRQLPSQELAALAVQLGADVPFFLKGGLCQATGIGDELVALQPLPETWLVLVYPGFGISTKEAYAKVKLPFKSVVMPAKAGTQSMFWAPASAGVTSKDLFNRFEELIFPDHPELPKLKKELLDAGATSVLMSGSGSVIFGLASSRAQGEQILARMQKTYNQSWLAHTV
jgi:4-diphosphocytidyl-2-C-methyl-D-erythritol kinase